MASSRRVTTDVANDFNNILQVIGGNAEMLLRGLDASDPRTSAAQSILDATRRASELTRRLERTGEPRLNCPGSWDLSAVVGEALPGLRWRLHPDVRVLPHLTRKLPRVLVDRAQIVDVLTNLIDNAAAAMPSGGTLSLLTDVVHVGPQMQRFRPWLRDGRFARLEIADSGPGLDETTLDHLFEPFTSRATRNGAGCDLSITYRLVKQAGGFIWAASEPGQGTRVTVLYPAEGERKPVPGHGGLTRGRVLLVEDDEHVRELVDEVLGCNGFSVTAYASAEAALCHEPAFDLLVTDVGLPGLDGTALAREIKRRTPAMPVLLMSAESGPDCGPDEPGPRAFLHKPFSSKALVHRVEELLSA